MHLSMLYCMTTSMVAKQRLRTLLDLLWHWWDAMKKVKCFGGRLYTHSPLEGYSEEEMIQEARLRMEHNKQRQRVNDRSGSGRGRCVRRGLPQR